jgi:hypothetical protein
MAMAVTLAIDCQQQRCDVTGCCFDKYSQCRQDDVKEGLQISTGFVLLSAKWNKFANLLPNEDQKGRMKLINASNFLSRTPPSPHGHD